MKVDEARAGGKAAELRRAFDQSFAEAPSSEVVARENLLAIRIGTGPYALRLAEVSGLFAVKKVTWVPSAVRELLGIAGFRGTMLPIYDLRVLLGCVVDTTPRWLVVASATPVGLAFDGLDGHLHVHKESIAPVAQADARPQHVREVVHASNPMRPIVDLASVLDAIKTLVRHGTPQKER